MTLILFDIDGTLVNTGGAGMRAMDRAFATLHGAERALEGIALAGRTDRVILRDALARVAPGRAVEAAWLEGFRATYCRMLEEELQNGDGTGKRVLPGVRPLLDALAHREDVALALLTGNFAASARLKLAHFDLWKYFAWGAFGDDHVDRNDLIAVAARTAAGHMAVAPAPDRTFVIGDTTHDIACARSGGARAIGVATGPVPAETLRAAGADVVLHDLADTARVLALFEN